VGGNVKIHQKLTALRDQLVADIVHCMDWSEADARSIVDRWLIGMRKPLSGSEGIAASPDAIRILDLIPRENTVPSKPQDWQSAVDLSKNFNGNSKTINKKLVELRTLLITDVRAAGIDPAENVVDDFLFGMKKPRKGNDALAVSPDGVRIAEQFGILSPRPPRR
jgi:hypothetical protein